MKLLKLSYYIPRWFSMIYLIGGISGFSTYIFVNVFMGVAFIPIAIIGFFNFRYSSLTGENTINYHEFVKGYSKEMGPRYPPHFRVRTVAIILMSVAILYVLIYIGILFLLYLEFPLERIKELIQEEKIGRNILALFVYGFSAIIALMRIYFYGKVLTSIRSK